MRTQFVYVNVTLPELPTLQKVQHSVSNETRSLFKITSFLQGTLSGLWEIDSSGLAQKKEFDLWGSINFDLLQVDLKRSKITDLGVLLAHFQLAKDRYPKIDYSEPAAILFVQGTKENSPTQLEIGAKQSKDGKVEVTYTFK